MNLLKLEIDKNRIYGLDILRAIAILAVVFGHSSLILHQDFFRFFILDGVSIFFVLSGYLIGGILIKLLVQNPMADFRLMADFWKRRWYRTLSNYFLILIILNFLSYFFSEGFSTLSIWRYYLFLQNFGSPHPIDFFPEAWSLSIEEWFYLLMPSMTFIIIRLFNLPPKKAILITAFVILIFSIGFRYVRYTNLSINSFRGVGLAFKKTSGYSLG